VRLCGGTPSAVFESRLQASVMRLASILHLRVVLLIPLNSVRAGGGW